MPEFEMSIVQVDVQAFWSRGTQLNVLTSMDLQLPGRGLFANAHGVANFIFPTA